MSHYRKHDYTHEHGAWCHFLKLLKLLADHCEPCARQYQKDMNEIRRYGR